MGDWWDCVSSWDDGTGMRHGVPGAAIKEFLRIHLPEVLGKAEGSGGATSEMKRVPSGVEVIDLT